MRVAVVGLGLIGGSIALAARARGAASVRGWDADPAAVAAAVQRGAIPSGAGSLASAVATAEVVFVAVPVNALAPVVGEVLTHAAADAVVTDVGSTKRTVVGAISDPRFVGGHPLAGSELSGVQHARADLFEGNSWYLTPATASAAVAAARLRPLIAGFGAEVAEIDAATHDRLMAAVSHLPHIFANVLVANLASAPARPALGPSFRDATRVAGSNPAVWSAIYLDNRDEVIAAIDHAVELLRSVRADLDSADAGALRRWCEQAAAEHARIEP